MALAFVGEAFLSASLQVLLDKIVSREFMNFFRSKKLDVSLLDKLQITLLTLQAVLNDAEEKQITNPAVKEWLDKLRDAVFDADDLLDEINTEALRCKVKAEYKHQTVSAKVRNILSSPFKQSCGVINSKMQTLFEKLEHFTQKGQLLGLNKGVSNSVWKRTPSSSVVDESAVFGRDGDKKKLKQYLLLEDISNSGNKIGVISIVGMGGIGKTTLAKLLYNDMEVKEKYDLKAWVYISQDFDVCRVTKTLLESITSQTMDTNDLNTLNLESVTSGSIDTCNLNTLQVQLQQSLSHKIFLIVLDDIWDGSYVKWNNLKDIFNAGEMGSKIIITTRDESVALAMQTFLPIHYLRPLKSEDCWSLLAKHAFGPGNCWERSNLESIGKEIAKKCDGLPLAAVALGGLLRTKLSQDDWTKVLKSKIWYLPNLDVQPALLLSYHYLPTPLKGCFAYCSIFPKNSKLERKMVVQLWIAEGLVHHSDCQKSLEEVGDEYFNELVSRSLIHRGSIDGEANFEMHDLINDLATMVSSAYCIRLDEHKPHESLERVRHLSYNKYNSLNNFDPLYGLKGLRTFLALPLLNQGSICYVPNKVIHELLPTMKQLQVLSLSNYGNITQLPDFIGNLIYLRYLNLSYTCIESLPSMICNLYNLQTLLLSNCDNLTELPKDMGKLVNLRHLDISYTCLPKIPAQIARLQNLVYLSDFIVSKQQDGLKIAELGKFPHLQGKLSISELHNVTDPSDAFQANLKMKEQIEGLELTWNSHNNIIQGSQIERLVLEHLEPSTNLKTLSITNYGGTTFPNWLGDSSFGNMVYLSISDCHHCSKLPPLGQLRSLKKLFISNMTSVKTIGAEFYGSSSPSFQPFPSLEILKFGGMLEWEEWILSGGTTTEFPVLRSLVILVCPKLNGNIPKILPCLTELKLRKCPLLESRHSNEENNITRSSNVFSQLMMPFNSIRKLTISCLPSLTSFPRDGLPKTLQSLSLVDCVNLEFLPHESLHSYTSLEDLRVTFSCDSMRSFTLGFLPVLKNLQLLGCKNLKLICIAEGASKSLSFLQSIKIWECNELQSFSPDGLPTPNLIHLDVYLCKKLNSLPEPINTLSDLQNLRIRRLPNLQSFAQGGLPINLWHLDVGELGGILSNASITEWSLEQLTCLSTLGLFSGNIVKALMQMDVPLLPRSLISIRIHGLNDIQCLDWKWLQHLTSLQKLEISSCPNLRSLPEQGFPSSLSLLSISCCPLLKPPKIDCIPCIVIDDKMIT